MSQEPNDTGVPDDTGASPPSQKENAKVELDLDDAPFLEEDEPEPAPAPKEAPRAERQAVPQPADSDDDQKDGRKKKMIIAGGAAGLLLVIGIVLKLFVFSGGEPVPVPAVPEPEKVLAGPKTAPPAPVPQFTLQWEPFWIELKDTEGAIRFLTFKFSIPTDNPMLFAEMNARMLILRDALFYYLRNQPILSLSDEDKVQTFKGDILTVINEHLSGAKASELLIQDYLVQ